MNWKDKNDIAAWRKVYRAKNKNKIAAYRKKHRSNNREKIDAKNREYCAANREKLKHKHKEYAKTYNRSEQRRAVQHRYNNSLKGRETSRRWQKTKGQLPENRAKRVAADAKRRAKELGSSSPCASIAIRKLRTTKSIKCYYCGKKISLNKLHIDHVYPLFLGGVHAAYNLVGACISCNLSKSKKHPNKFIKGQQLLVF